MTFSVYYIMTICHISKQTTTANIGIINQQLHPISE